MGREIRRVPSDWEHPRQPCTHSPWQGGCDDAKRHNGQCLKPLHDKTYEEAAREYFQAVIAWSKGEYEGQEAGDLATFPYYWDYGGMPPEADDYLPVWTSEPTHYQVYETVSEGTPVTPHFATKEELIEYLVKHGDAWDQWQGNSGWSRRAAEQFVADESCPSMVRISTPTGNTLLEPRNMDQWK